MFRKNTARLASVGVVALALVGTSVSVANAVEANGSDAPYYLLDANTGVQVPAGTVNNWYTAVVGSINPADIDSVFTCPAEATSVKTFVAPRGQERLVPAWSAFTDSAFYPGTKNVLLPNSDLSGLTNGNGAQVRAQGGNYSVGFACLRNNHLNVTDTGIWFTNIKVTPVSGDWTFDTPTPSTPGTPPVGSADVNLTATTIAAEDGVLSLVVPANASATIGNPTLVNQLSTSTGKLGEFTVKDSRILTHAGWTLTSTVVDFVKSDDAAVTIDKKQLGVAPRVVSSTAAGVTASAAQIAGSAAYPAAFADAGNGAQVGDTVFDADLVFVSPANKPAGTYTSKLTLTLASK